MVASGFRLTQIDLATARSTNFLKRFSLQRVYEAATKQKTHKICASEWFIAL